MKKWLLRKYIPISRLKGKKPYPIYDQNGRNQLKLIPYLWPKQPKNHTLWGRTNLYSPYKGVPSPPRPGMELMGFIGISIWDLFYSTRLVLTLAVQSTTLRRVDRVQRLDRAWFYLLVTNCVGSIYATLSSPMCVPPREDKNPHTSEVPSEEEDGLLSPTAA